MDSVRFGRALGIGVREAAKAAVKAADAAAAPSPAPVRPSSASGSSEPKAGQERPAVRASDAPTQTRHAARGLRQGGKRFGEAVWGPFAKLSGVLWHEIMGVLFGMFAAVAGVEAWHGRGTFQAGGAGRTHEWGAVAMLVVFGYFTTSSFVKASRRQRR